jgi:SAM-dependent methyltransferase
MEIEWLPPDRATSCPVCATGASATWRVAAPTFVPGRERVRFAACDRCGSIFDPEFALVELQHPERMTDYYLEQGAGLDVMVAPLLRVPRDSVRRYLEIGCGYGLCLDFARRELGWEGIGVDPSTQARAGQRELGLPILLEPLRDDLPLGDAPFQLAYASEVLEHVAAPLPFLRAVRSRLSGDGLLALTTPDAATVTPELPTDVLLRALSPGLHAVLYTAPTLARVLRDAGFADTRIERGNGTLRAFAGVSATALERLGPPRAGEDELRRYLAGRLASAPRGSSLACGLAYRCFKADVNAGDHRAAEASRSSLRAALRARHRVDLDRPAATAGADLPRRGPFPFNLANALYFCGIHELNGRRDAGRAVDCFRAAAELGQRILREEQAAGIGDGETEDLYRQSLRHVVIALARRDGSPALAALADLERGASQVPPALSAAQLRRTRAQVFLELVNRGDHAAARTLEEAVAADREQARGDGEEAGFEASLAFARGLVRLEAGDPHTAALRFASAHAAACACATPGSAAAGVLWESRLLEAEALRRVGRWERAATVVRGLLAVSAVPVPPAVATRAAEIATAVAAAAAAAPRRLELAHGIDAYWRDAHGVYLRGWAHAHEAPVRRLRLEAGARSVATSELSDRPDLLPHFPAHPHVRRAGFALYLETGAGVPVSLIVETDAGAATCELALPDHALPRWQSSTDEESDLPRLVREFIAAVNALGPDGLVLEIGVRGTSRTEIDRHLMARRAGYQGPRPLGVDIHPGPLVDLVGDVHELSAFVRPGSISGVMSGAVLEHLEAPWVVAAEINRVLRIGGVAYHAAPTAWPEHAMPNDFWRFTCEGLAVLFGPHTGFEVLAKESSGSAALIPEPGWRDANLELPVFAASAFSHILVRKVRELEPSAVAWPTDRSLRAARARQYPVDGVVGGR